MHKLILFVISILFLSSCITYQKKEFRTHKFLQENPHVLAQYCTDEFPVKEIFIKGKEIIVRDTVTNTLRDTVDCPDGTKVACPETKTFYEKITVRDTIKQIDSAALFILQKKVRDLNFLLDKSNTSLDHNKDLVKYSQKKQNTYFWILIGFGAVTLIYLGIRLKGIL